MTTGNPSPTNTADPAGGRSGLVLPFLCVMAWAAVDAVLWVKADCALAEKESES